MSFGDPERLEGISPISVVPRERFKLNCQMSCQVRNCQVRTCSSVSVGLPGYSISVVPRERFKLNCQVCGEEGSGAKIQCDRQSCFNSFHVSCALLGGLHLGILQGEEEDHCEQHRMCRKHRPSFIWRGRYCDSLKFLTISAVLPMACLPLAVAIATLRDEISLASHPSLSSHPPPNTPNTPNASIDHDALRGDGTPASRPPGGGGGGGGGEEGEGFWWVEAVVKHWEQKRRQRGGHFLGRRLAVRILEKVSWDDAAAAQHAHRDPFRFEEEKGKAGPGKKASRDKKKKQRKR
ncbi:hypothetical protein T484DRAFT_1778439 [Baffinella frigidus]|nr:hypothetical protein T484DRAFT_1778439 [Cryptophyta sp. CCMP2293]